MLPKHSGPILAQRDSLTVIDCRACGWAHLDPLPDIPAGYYESEFWATKGAGWLERYEAERDWLDMRNRDWLSVVEEHTAGRTLLDVGCGYGFFVAHAYSNGWAARGIDPSKEAIEWACNNYAAVEFSEIGWDYPGFNHSLRFDCISALWLMEHLPNPFEFLGWARAHLAPDGALLLCVPNEWNLIQAQANRVTKTPNWWVHLTHLNYWSAPTLYGMLGRAGFKVVDALGSFPIEQCIIEGADYPVNEAIGDEMHAGVRTAEQKLTRENRLDTARKHGRQSVGRDLVVICK